MMTACSDRCALGSNWRSKSTHPNYPKPPNVNDCCGSGCINCVWIEYAQTLIDFYSKQLDPNQDLGVLNRKFDQVTREIDKIEEPNMRSYLLLEIELKKCELLAKLSK